MGIVYLISVLILLISFILRKKSEREMDIISFISVSITLLFCYNTLVSYILTLFSIPIKLGILTLINLTISIFFIVPIIKKKEIQKYVFSKIDILYITIIVLVILSIVYIFLGFPFDVNYASSDPVIHFFTSLVYAEQDTLMPNATTDTIFGDLSPRRPASYVNSGLLIKCFCDYDDRIQCYNVFVSFGIFTLIMIGVTIYTGLKQYAKNKEHIFWALIITLICILGYPLNSFLFGFEYLTMSLLILVTIFNVVQYYETKNFKFSYIILMFMLLNFGLFCSYYMFVPFVYAALWIYFYIKNHKENKKILTKKLILLWIFTLIIPFILGYIYHIEPKMYSMLNKNISSMNTSYASDLNSSQIRGNTNSYFDEVKNYAQRLLTIGLEKEGFAYINLYSNMLLLLPLPIYLFAKSIKKNKEFKENLFFALILFFAILFLEILLLGNLFEKVSAYYLSKVYYAIWIILFYINYKASIEISESELNNVSRLFIMLYILLMIICIPLSKVTITEKTQNKNENIFTVMDIFGANKTILLKKESEFNQDELEIIKYAKANLDYNSNIEMVSSHKTYYWSYILLEYFKEDIKYKKYRGEELFEKKWNNSITRIRNRENIDYVIYFTKSSNYKRVQDILFENAEIIYENEAGGILKYNN